MQKQTRLLNLWIINHVVLPMAETSQVENRLRAILRPGSVRWGVSGRGVVFIMLVTTAVLAPIALLRIVPASAHLLTSPLSSTSSFEAADKTPMAYDTLPANPHWTRRVSKSVAVEVVGVVAGWGKSATSWTPDGTPFAQPLYRRTEPEMQPQYLDKEMVREFAVRLTHPAGSAAEICCQIPVQGHSSFSYDTGPSYNNGVQITDEHEFSPATGGLRVISTVLPKSLSHAVLRIGVAAGPWRYTASCPPEGNGSVGIGNADGSEDEVLFGRVLEIGSQKIFTVSDTYVKQDCRVIAIGTNGQVYDMQETYTQNAPKFRVTTVKFNTPLTQIKEFRFQTRPYEWVEFRNIALNSNATSVSNRIQVNKEYAAFARAYRKSD